MSRKNKCNDDKSDNSDYDDDYEGEGMITNARERRMNFYMHDAKS